MYQNLDFAKTQTALIRLLNINVMCKQDKENKEWLSTYGLN